MMINFAALLSCASSSSQSFAPSRFNKVRVRKCSKNMSGGCLKVVNVGRRSSYNIDQDNCNLPWTH